VLMQFDPGLEYKPNRGEIPGVTGPIGAIDGPPGSQGVIGVGPGGVPLPPASVAPTTASGTLVAHNNPNHMSGGGGGGSTGPGGNKDDAS
jgi:hypothetical protein